MQFFFAKILPIYRALNAHYYYYYLDSGSKSTVLLTKLKNERNYILECINKLK